MKYVFPLLMLLTLTVMGIGCNNSTETATDDDTTPATDTATDDATDETDDNSTTDDITDDSTSDDDVADSDEPAEPLEEIDTVEGDGSDLPLDAPVVD